jgi:hypothetical protein
MERAGTQAARVRGAVVVPGVCVVQVGTVEMTIRRAEAVH